MALNGSPNIARERWVILREAILKKKVLQTAGPFSQRVHNSLPLFEVTTWPRTRELKAFQPNFEQTCTWHEYKCDMRGNQIATVLVRKISSVLGQEDLRAIDNTGNICIWASEQAMAHYCLLNIEKFNDKSVIEIGGGNTCLAGVFLAKYGNLSRAVLTDGNSKAVFNVAKIVSKNLCDEASPKSRVETLQLCWDDEISFSHQKGQFDFLLCADCLHRKDLREKLAIAIFKLLKSDGEALIFSPKRGKASEDFLYHARRLFGDSGVAVTHKYDEKLWAFHQYKKTCPSYDQNIHYPILMKLKNNLKLCNAITAASYA